MIRTVTAIDDLVLVRNVIIYVTDFNNLDVLIRGLLKYCPNVTIYSTASNYPTISTMAPFGKIQNNLFSFDQLVLEPDINRTLVEPFQSKLFLGLLGKTYCLQHQKIIKDTKTVPIDLMIINLSPIIIPEGPNDFENASTRIDFAGQAMLSASIANSPRVTTLGDPSHYKDLIAELKKFEGHTSFNFRLQAAAKSASCGQKYSSEVASFLSSVNIEEAKGCYEIINSAEETVGVKD